MPKTQRPFATMTMFCLIDDKYVPLHRILWVSNLPHYCGSEECEREGSYEVKLDAGESVWATREQRDTALEAIETWQGGNS